MKKTFIGIAIGVFIIVGASFKFYNSISVNTAANKNLKSQALEKAEIESLLALPIEPEKASEVKDNEEYRFYTFMLNRPNLLLLVNRNHQLEKDYAPRNLVKAEVSFLSSSSNEEMLMQKNAADALKEMFDAADKQGLRLFGVSAYRSFASQQSLYNEKLKSRGKSYVDSYVAFPGESEHQTGLAIDIRGTVSAYNANIKDFGQTKEGTWIRNNAQNFGFIIRYPKGKEIITGYRYEPWHIRYVGQDVAEKIKESNIVLEEYVNQVIN
ncbi:M15 family metallopeptidase [Clostridium sp. YIM B02515]|uniref:M15 family metallopeptidase n=1 Tax=Clostridium rhizosphaerae TaxID=2803861 RepID=A0ABS1TB57_9CLOT|nr:M15 family metallopeptidase [Clostridium rhizosphaerae]MBL4936584.1 M15 family metallopeptidase [Clostridium rhizosphaerae]